MSRKEYKILIPCLTLAGHHLEYLRNFYKYALVDNSKNHEYMFALSDKFKPYFDKFDKKSSIKIMYLPDNDLKNLETGNRFMASYRNNKAVLRVLEKYPATDVLYLAFSHFFFTQSIQSKPGVHYSGILFGVYPYIYKNLSIKHKINEVVPHWFAVHNKWVKNIYIANDTSAVAYFNKLFKTEKFKFIPDPFVPINTDFDAITVLGDDLEKMSGKKILFHFGAIRPNKGTVELLEAIKLIPYDVAKQLCFVIAGKVSQELHDKIYSLVKECSKKTTLIFHDEFCSFEYIAAVCLKADYILMPYKYTSQSSGMYGYASQFGVPVVALNKNMTRKIVTREHLGILLDDVSPEGLAKFYETVPTRPNYMVSEDYIKHNTVDNFNNAIFNEIFK